MGRMKRAPWLNLRAHHPSTASQQKLKKYKREKSVLLEKHTEKAMQFKRTLMYPANFACNNTNLIWFKKNEIFKDRRKEVAKNRPTILGM
jgi:hypothetical protein